MTGAPTMFCRRCDVYDPLWWEIGEAGREEAREWLRQCGGDPNMTRAVEVTGEGCAVAEVLIIDIVDGRTVDRYEHQTLVCTTPPPWWRP